jgi:nucleoside-diphosphate-sugar epimerase
VRRILVTGAEGTVGSALVAHLLAHGHEVTTLTLPDAVPQEGVKVVHGDARDRRAVARAVADVDAVAHLAAIPDPRHEPATELFANNATATFVVCWTAAEHGVRRFAVASSINATGLPMNPHRPRPARYPVDESTAPDLADAYSLSKHTDENTLRVVCRRFGASGVALRLPLMVPPERRAEMRAQAAERLDEGPGEGWGWLDTRDGAQAFRLALVGDYAGAHVAHVAAADVFADVPTEELLDRYAAGVPRTRSFPGRAVPIDTRLARELLGFVPRYGGD